MNYEERIAELQKQIDELKSEIKNGDAIFNRVPLNDIYYRVKLVEGKAIAEAENEDDTSMDSNSFANNNYFYSMERAEEVAEKINTILKLERIHDMVCPEHKPDWTADDEEKCCITVDPHCKKVEHTVWYVTNQTPSVYFPTDKIDEAIKLYDEMC